MTASVALVLGKRPRPGTVVAEVMDHLITTGLTHRVHLPHDDPVAPADLTSADLVLHRGLDPRHLPLLDAVAEAGTPVCNPPDGIRRLLTKDALHAALVAAEIPTPTARVHAAWPAVLAEEEQARNSATGQGPGVVVKAVDGAGRGAGVLPSPLPARPPLEGPWIVERHIPNDGLDRKLYVIGDRVHGLLKPSTLTADHTEGGSPFTVPADVARLARRTAQELEVHLCGVDVLLGPDGPVVVDVNPFPGYRGVERAARDVADHVRRHLEFAPCDPPS